MPYTKSCTSPDLQHLLGNAQSKHESSCPKKTWRALSVRDAPSTTNALWRCSCFHIPDNCVPNGVLHQKVEATAAKITTHACTPFAKRWLGYHGGLSLEASACRNAPLGCWDRDDSAECTRKGFSCRGPAGSVVRGINRTCVTPLLPLVTPWA